METTIKHILIFSLLLLPRGMFLQIDSLILYDPYSLLKTDIIVEYDTNYSIEQKSSSIGNLENKVNLVLTLSDSVQNEFTHNYLTSETYDMMSYPIRTNVALHSNKFFIDKDYYKASGSGILISPNAVLTAGHVIGYESNNAELGKYFKWKDSIYVSPSLQGGYPQPKIGAVKVKKCYLFKGFVNALGHKASEDIALMILEKPIGHTIGWLGFDYVPSDTFLLNNVFYNFSYPGTDGYDGFNMWYKYGNFSNVSSDLTSAYSNVAGIPGESGSGVFYTNNTNYTVYGIRTYSSFYTLMTEHKFRIFNELVEQNFITSVNEFDRNNNRIITYPNPASNAVFVQFLNLEHSLYRLLIINMQGQVLFEESGFNNNAYIDVSNFKSGLYVIELIIGNNKLIDKLIIE